MSLRIANSFATIFNPEISERFAKASLTSGRKLKTSDNTDKWANSYWNATFVGDAFTKFKELNPKDKDSIYIISASIAYEASRGKDLEIIKDENGKSKYYLNLTVFEFVTKEEHYANNPKKESPHKAPAPTAESTDSDDLPF